MTRVVAATSQWPTLLADEASIRRHDKRIRGVRSLYRENRAKGSLGWCRDITADAHVSTTSIIPEDVELEMIFGAVIEQTIKSRQAFVCHPSSIHFRGKSGVAPLAEAVKVLGKYQSLVVSIHLESRSLK